MNGLGDPFTASWPMLEYTLRVIKLCLAKYKKSWTIAKRRLPITPDILRKLREYEIKKRILRTTSCYGQFAACIFMASGLGRRR